MQQSCEVNCGRALAHGLFSSLEPVLRHWILHICVSVCASIADNNVFRISANSDPCAAFTTLQICVASAGETHVLSAEAAPPNPSLLASDFRGHIRRFVLKPP